MYTYLGRLSSEVMPAHSPTQDGQKRRKKEKRGCTQFVVRLQSDVARERCCMPLLCNRNTNAGRVRVRLLCGRAGKRDSRWRTGYGK